MTQPAVTVIIPVRNEERYIERCLYSIAAQDYPRALLDVIVVDGMSGDRTREIVARFAAESTLDVRLIGNPARKPAAAMNQALAQAQGELVCRVDGHAALAPDYVRLGAEALQRSDADCVGGVLHSEGDTYAGRAIALAMSSRFGVGGAAFRVGGAGPVDTAAFGLYRRDVFDQIGAFAEDIDRGEDDELNYRLRDAGGLILLVPDMRATYTVRGGLRSLWRQYYGYGRAKPEVLRRHPAQLQARQMAPPVFAILLYGATVRAVFGRRRPLIRVLSVYTPLATIASLVLARRHGVRYFPALMAAFPCLHCAYGTGFLAGLVGLAGRLVRRDTRRGALQGTEAPQPPR